MSAEAFARLHRRGEPLRLLNAWDAGSARLFAAAGAPALGTTSAGVAFALGKPDGQRIDRDDAVAATAQIVAAVGVPVSADIEAGFGETAADVGETVRRIVATGAVGVNIEDATGDAAAPLFDVDEQVARLEAARAAADAEGVALFINARTDVYLHGVGAPETRLDEATRRLGRYVQAGGDGVFVPGVTDRDVIARLASAMTAPLNVLVVPGSPPVAELSALGVARVSVGSGPSRAALALLRRIAEEYLGQGTYEAMTEDALAYADANALFG